MRRVSSLSPAASRAFSSQLPAISPSPFPHHPFSSHLPVGLSQSSDCVVDKAKGSYVWGVNGRKYLDFTCGIGVTNLGHCHPQVDEKVVAQVSKGAHLQVNCVTSLPMLEYAQRLGKHLPSSMQEDYQVLFSNSGAESIENAIKLARIATKRQTVVVFQGGFHGRTIATGALTTAKYIYRSGFQPSMAGVHVVPFPYCHRCPVSAASAGSFHVGHCCQEPLAQLRQIVKQQTGVDEVAAVLVEPVQGEGGYLVPPEGFLQAVSSFAKEIGALFIADEVQCGFGRTGHVFAHQTFGYQPDILVMAKGIANGYPLSAIATRSEILSKAKPGSIGGTYGGNSVSLAAAHGVLDVFEQSDVLEESRKRGDEFRAGLRALSARFPIADVRGVGLMNAIEFKDDCGVKGAAGAFVKAAVEEDLLVLSAGIHEAIRFIPPVNISKEELQEGLAKIEKALVKVFGQAK